MKSQMRFLVTSLTASLLLHAAQAEVVLVVSSKSGASNLSKEQVSDIYHLRLKELPGGGTAVPLMIAGGSTRNDFLSNVLGKSDAQMKAYWAKLTFTGKGSAPKEVDSSAEIKKLVAANPNMIGFMEKADADGSVKVVYGP